MKSHFPASRTQLFLIMLLCIIIDISAQVEVGDGSYTTSFPGTDSAGRNSFPSGTPQLTGNAIGQPVPTNDWWSKLVKENHADNLFNYPMTLKTTNQGLIVTYIPWGVIGDSAPIEVGLTGLNTNKTTVSDYSDWTVSMNWDDNTRNLTTTAGIGMPFLYFDKDANSVVEIKVNSGTTSISNELLIIENAASGADFVFYAPTGSTWSQSGNIFTSTLNAKNYWSMAMLPQSTTNVSAAAQAYQSFAYVFPTNTTTTWSYEETSSKLTTNFVVETDLKEGTETNMLLGLLPHQWSNLAPSSPVPTGDIYKSVRGDLKLLAGNSFSVENTFKGILPTLPYLNNYSEGFSPSALAEKITQLENDGLSTWTDSYNEGQVMNRLIQTARIADQTGDIEARDKMVTTIKNRLEDWLTYQSGEVAFLFYYNNNWSTMLGYPAGHGQDSNINDHHFHWGYFIHAAAFMEQFEPGWVNQWGEMINLLIRDAASADRNDDLFPFLRNFSPYAGHSWANGFATFPQGNDQESTSESMQFASSLIHWGSITDNDAIRDLGIYIYTTEQTAIEEYWFDVYERNFQASQQYSLVSRVWGNSYDNGTFWTADIAASYGIELYPIHGGSLYLGHQQEYASTLWDEMTANTGVLTNQENPNLWHDTYWKFLSLTDPQAAIDLYDSYPDRNLKFGISDAHTYHWLHAMNALGTVNTSITADHPIAVAFTNNDGETTYVAHNYSNSPIQVNFSDTYTLEVPANQMATSRDVEVSGVITSDFMQAYPGGSVNLSVNTSGSGITKVEFFDGNNSVGEDNSAPYTMTASNLTLGIHEMYAKVFINDQFNVTNIISIQVGEQKPYLDVPFSIPGIIEAGMYDKFEGGRAQGIAYVDVSAFNEGDFRTQEYVDAVDDFNEGKIVGWTSAGEWLEYTIEVQTPGNYNLNLRYASGNSNGGGPFHFEIDGNIVSSDINLSTTNTWDNWSTATVSNIALPQGEHILRLVIDQGEFNLGAMDFSYESPLDYVPPIANAGENINVIIPNSTANLDGASSFDPEGQNITYVWEQIYGPSTVNFSSISVASPGVSNLVEGIYKFRLNVSDGTYSDDDEVLIIVSTSGNASPTVSISSPVDGDSYAEGSPIIISAGASDLDGNVTLVEFFDGSTKLGEDLTAPFSYNWTNASLGSHQLTAVATDDGGEQSTSQVVNINVNEVTICTEISNLAQQGSFSVGYEVTFETIGTAVNVSFKLLDTDKTGVVAYLWRQSPFEESQMTNTSDLTFTKTISGLSPGETISYACKFAYSGGLSATQYFDYVVGNNCGNNEDDTEAPTDFTATIGAITATSVEVILNGNDDSGTVIYELTYNGTTSTVTANSGVETTTVLTNLTPETTYNIGVSAKDLNGNNAPNNPIDLVATTTANTNTSCEGTDSEALQGTFSTGYHFSFETNGSEVTFNFELLDTDKTGVIAYLWQESPFIETPMNPVSGTSFTQTLSGFTAGESISFACKFAYAGGLAVTKYLTYEVGSNCSLSVEDQNFIQISLYPNPVNQRLYLQSPFAKINQVEVFSLNAKLVKQFESVGESLDLSDLSSGLYFIKLKTDQGIVIKKILKD